MSYMASDEMVRVLIDRISDFECDPEPQWDDLLQSIPNHIRLHLKHALIESLTTYKKEVSR